MWGRVKCENTAEILVLQSIYKQTEIKCETCIEKKVWLISNNSLLS